MLLQLSFYIQFRMQDLLFYTGVLHLLHVKYLNTPSTTGKTPQTLKKSHLLLTIKVPVSHNTLSPVLNLEKGKQQYWDLQVVDKILWINLLLIKDNIDAGVALKVNTTVIEGLAVSFCWGTDMSTASLGVLPHQDQSSKHDLVPAFLAGVSV